MEVFTKNGTTDSVTLDLTRDGRLYELEGMRRNVRDFEHYLLALEPYEQRVAELVADGYSLQSPKEEHREETLVSDPGTEEPAVHRTLERLRKLQASPPAKALASLIESGMRLEASTRFTQESLKAEFRSRLQSVSPILFPSAPRFENWWALHWRRGLIDAAIGCANDDDVPEEVTLAIEDDRRHLEIAWPHVVRALLRHPCAAFMRFLDLELAYPSALNAFSLSKAPPTLVELRVPTQATQVDVIASALPGLELLVMDSKALNSFHTVSWPNLRVLELTLSDGRDEPLAMDIHRAAPNVRILRIQCSRHTRHVLAELARTNVLDELDVLAIDDPDDNAVDVAASLAEHEQALSQIPHLVLSAYLLPPLRNPLGALDAVSRWENVVWS